MSENAPRRITPQNLGTPKGVTFVHAAVGRSHTLLVGSNGDVWSAGANSVGQVRSLYSIYTLLYMLTKLGLCIKVWPATVFGGVSFHACEGALAWRCEGEDSESCSRSELLNSAS